MSIGISNNKMTDASTMTETNADQSNKSIAEPTEQIRHVVNSVQALITPVWPLRDYVAVNPYGGFSNRTLLDAGQQLKRVSDCETTMPLDFYKQKFQEGTFDSSHLEAAIDELVADKRPGSESLSADSIHEILSSDSGIDSSGLPQVNQTSTERIWTVAQRHDQLASTSWSTTFVEEISKYCAAHFDEGQATWSSPHKNVPLYAAWLQTAKHDRRVEILGLSNFRRFVGELPENELVAIDFLLRQSGVPESMWQDYLHSICQSIPGWSAWTNYKTIESSKKCVENEAETHNDFAGLLAMSLAYEVALSRQSDIQVETTSSDGDTVSNGNTKSNGVSDDLLRYVLLRANEIGFRNRVLTSIGAANNTDKRASLDSQQTTGRRLAQMVFCIDVRSERIRRHLEATSNEVETFGFAGFFGLPFEYVRLGDNSGTPQLPVLIDPQFKVYEGLRSEDNAAESIAVESRHGLRAFRRAWKRFQTSAVSCFAFVETTGLFYAGTLLKKSFGIPYGDSRFDGVPTNAQGGLGPTFRDLHSQGVSASQQCDMAESILRGMGLTDDFARLVVFCGHGSQTENNPLQSGLDCGACAGHSGESNARFAAMLLNQRHVRETLAERGIQIPDAVHFLAGLHNTTTDQIDFFDLDLLPKSHNDDAKQLTRYTEQAGEQTRSERLSVLPGTDTKTILQRSKDWSEVRPEWGLTGNAQFIVAPRDMTKSLDLQGKSFLHSYDFRLDPEGKVLEQILTAPLVVGNWINMQYYASTVDQKHYGSGNKTIHNVVGKFGVLSGNGGDLQTGLPWQSLHDGERYHHDPMRLLAVVAAPRDSIDRILNAHENVRDLVVNGWVQMVAIDEKQHYRYSSSGEWRPLETTEVVTAG